MKRIEPAVTPINPKRLLPQKRSFIASTSSNSVVVKPSSPNPQIKSDSDDIADGSSQPKKFKLCKIVGSELGHFDRCIMNFRYVDAEGNDYQPPYFPPPQFEQQNGQYTTFQQDGQDGQFSQQAIIMNEDGQELLEEIDENGQPQQQRQIIVGGDNYIITQDGLAVQAVDGQQVIMCEVVFLIS